MSSPSSVARASLERISHPSNRLGLAAVVLLIAAAGFAIHRSMPVLHAITLGGAASDANADSANEAVVKYAANLQNHAGQVNGRSFFFDPPPPPPPYVPPPPAPEVKYEPPRPPPPPSIYGGPKVIGTAIDTVWFDNSKTMRVGGPLENEMRVLSISTAPYIVRIEWKGVEFDVPFMPRDAVIDKSRQSTSSSSYSSPSTSPSSTPSTTPPASSPPPSPTTTPPTSDSPAGTPTTPPTPSETTPPAPPPPGGTPDAR